MINHARTLLLNQPGKNYMPGVIGEEYTPRDYTPRRLPSYVLFPHRLLFGTDPDKVFLNFRAQELLQIIHATELAKFLYSHDSRVTYLSAAQSEFFSANKAAAFKKIYGYTRTRMYIQGQPRADNIRGKSFNDYFIRIITTNDSFKALVTAASSFDDNAQPLIFNNGPAGSSNKIDLPNSNMQVNFANITDTNVAAMLLEQVDQPILTENYLIMELEAGETMPFMANTALPYTIDATNDVIVQWRLQTYARPSNAISTCLPKLELLGEPLFLELFGVRNDVEPYATFKNIWFNHPAPNYRLAAFVLAMIYRTEESRG